MSFEFGKSSSEKKLGLHQDLVAVLDLAITRSRIDFAITQGLRTLKEQALLVEQKRSWTMNSRHLTGDAFDVAPYKNGKICFTDKELLAELAECIFKAADDLGIVIQWGGDWDMDGDWKDEKKLDMFHFQIPFPYNVEKAKNAQKERIKLRENK